MSLESRLDKIPLKYLKKAVTATANTFYAMYAFPSFSVRGIDEKKEDWLETAIGYTPMMTVVPLQVSMVALEPAVFNTIVATNVASLGYESFRGANFLRKNWEEIPQRVKDFFSKSDNEVGEKESAFPSYASMAVYPFKKIIKAATVFAMTYLVAGSLAVVDFMHRPRAEQNFSIEEVNLKLDYCTLVRNEQNYKFVLVGENHFYSYSSMEVSKNLFARYNFSQMLSEGAEEPGSREVKRNAAKDQVPLILPILAVVLGSRLEYSGISFIADDNNVETIYLEKFQKNGLKEGITPVERRFHLAAGIAGSLTAPAIYFASTPLEYYGWTFDMNELKGKKFEKFKQQFPGLTTARDINLTKSAVEKMNPNGNYLVRVGAGHFPGMKQEFTKYGALTCQPIPLETLAPKS